MVLVSFIVDFVGVFDGTGGESKVFWGRNGRPPPLCVFLNGKKR